MGSLFDIYLSAKEENNPTIYLTSVAILKELLLLDFKPDIILTLVDEIHYQTFFKMVSDMSNGDFKEQLKRFSD